MCIRDSLNADNHARPAGRAPAGPRDSQGKSAFAPAARWTRHNVPQTAGSVPVPQCNPIPDRARP
eukprot:3909544-Pyramimonas_sp.AAC.1